VLKVADTLDYEQDHIYTLQIKTIDSGSPSLNYTDAVYVSVLDVNEAPTDIFLNSSVVSTKPEAIGYQVMGYWVTFNIKTHSISVFK